MQVSLEEASEKLPELISLVECGESIIITRDEIPVADLMPKFWLAKHGHKVTKTEFSTEGSEGSKGGTSPRFET